MSGELDHRSDNGSSPRGEAASDWRRLSFDECAEPARHAKESVLQRNYRPRGRFPVVDQGAEPVAGYTDDESLVYTGPLPVIVFGDHTRALKFVDFEFATGAEGTKLLAARTEVVDPLFLYYAWRAVPLESRGYNRHFSLLREKLIAAPKDLREQRAIAGVLSKIQRALDLEDRNIAALKELKAATMAKVFREGLRGEPLRMTEIGEVPHRWEVREFGRVATLHRGFDLPVQNRQNGTVPVIGSNGIVGHHVRAKVQGPGVVIGRSGTIGQSYYSPTDFWPLNTGLFVEDFHGNLPLYIHFFFEQFDFSRFATGVSVPTLNRNLVHVVPVSLPPLDEQIEIAEILRVLEARIAEAKRSTSALCALFSSALHQLMTGQLRVTSLLQGVEAANA